MTKKNDLVAKLLSVGGEKPTKKYYMKRFEDNFTLVAIDYKLLQRIREQATFPGKKKGETELDDVLFGMLIIEKGVQEPSFSDPALSGKFGTAVDAIQELLLPGEISKLSAEIMNLSGFADDEDEDELKN